VRLPAKGPVGPRRREERLRTMRGATEGQVDVCLGMRAGTAGQVEVCLGNACASKGKVDVYREMPPRARWDV
jgi:hypothetical protein